MNYKLETPKYAPLEGRKEADIAIVGGGIAGVSNAFYLGNNGYNVALLEGDQIGSGATGAALCIVTPSDYEVHDLKLHRGIRRAVLFYRTNFETLNEFNNSVANQIGVTSYKRNGATAIMVEEDPELLEALKDYYVVEKELREKHDLPPIRVVYGNEARRIANSKPNYGVVQFGNEVGSISPTELLDRLADHSKAQIYEGTRALRIRDKGKKVIVDTENGQVIANRAIVATQGIEPGGTYRPHIERSYAHMIATEELSPTQIATLGSWTKGAMWTTVDDASGIVYVYGGVANNRLYFGGELEPEAQSITDADYQALHSSMIRMFPQLKDVKIENAWGDSITWTDDWMPVVAKEGNRIYIDSITGGGVMVGMTIARLMPYELQGEQHPYMKMASADRFK